MSISSSAWKRKPSLFPVLMLRLLLMAWKSSTVTSFTLSYGGVYKSKFKEYKMADWMIEWMNDWLNQVSEWISEWVNGTQWVSGVSEIKNEWWEKWIYEWTHILPAFLFTIFSRTDRKKYKNRYKY